MSIATNIKTIRQMRAMTQEDLADAIGVTQECISIYENGKRIPNKKTIQRIADGLGVSVELLKAEALEVVVAEKK